MLMVFEYGVAVIRFPGYLSSAVHKQEKQQQQIVDLSF